jgi:hypothetical protein
LYLRRNLASDCAVIVRTVPDALADASGAEDQRLHGERHHDALHEAIG